MKPYFLVCQVWITNLAIGAVVGELGVLTNEPCSANAKASTHVEAIYLKTMFIQSLMFQCPAVKQELWRTAGIRIASSVLLDEAMFKGWGPHRILHWLENASLINSDQVNE